MDFGLFDITRISQHRQHPEQRAQHVLALRDPRHRLHAQRMQRKQRGQNRAPPYRPGHPPEYHRTAGPHWPRAAARWSGGGPTASTRRARNPACAKATSADASWRPPRCETPSARSGRSYRPAPGRSRSRRACHRSPQTRSASRGGMSTATATNSVMVMTIDISSVDATLPSRPKDSGLLPSDEGCRATRPAEPSGKLVFNCAVPCSTLCCPVAVQLPGAALHLRYSPG